VRRVRRSEAVFSASSRRIPAAALTVSGPQTVRVVHAITWGTGLAYITGEVPPCPAKTQVIAGYKYDAKSPLDARVAVTASDRHRPQGCQQRQSSPALRDERPYLKQPVRAPVTRIVSPRAPATKWPTGSFLPATSWFAKNHPHGDCCGTRRAKHNALGPLNVAACLIWGTACEGSPGAGNPHAGKYSELTLSRQRGGGGLTATPLPTRPTLSAAGWPNVYRAGPNARSPRNAAQGPGFSSFVQETVIKALTWHALPASPSRGSRPSSSGWAGFHLSLAARGRQGWQLLRPGYHRG